jgi:ribosomal-protein-alanine N-acetyltransferase
LADEVEIVHAGGVDAETCARLLLPSDPWKSLGYGPREAGAIAKASSEGNTLVARVGGAIVGFTLSQPGFLGGEYLKILVVDAAHRSKGIGARLMAQLEADVFARASNLFLCVSDFNAEARAFYRRLGYTEVGALTDFLVKGASEILMRKTKGPLRR